MDSEVKRTWEDFLNPEITRPRLIAASIYIAGFESLKEAIVDRIRAFFCIGFDETGDRIDPKYQSDVLDRNRSPVFASLDWLKMMNVIDEDDVASFERVKACRNILAHELLSTLGSPGLPADFEQCFSEMFALLKKVEVWWIINVEIPTNPDFDGEDVDENGIVSGRMLILELLLDIALGDDGCSRYYYDKIRKEPDGT